MGVALFEGNRRRQVVLTASGAFFAERVRQILSGLAAATSDTIALGGRNRALRLGIPPTFGSRWLIPRLPTFFAAHPEIAVEFSTRVPGRPGPGMENLDALIDFARAPGQHGEWHRLIEVNLQLVASPGIAQRLATSEPDAHSKIQLLVHRTQRQELASLFEAENLRGLRHQPVLVFESYAMLFQALNTELGIGLAPSVFIQSELMDGRLVPVSKVVIRSKNTGYLVLPHESVVYPPLDAFRKWLFAAARMPSLLQMPEVPATDSAPDENGSTSHVET